MAKEGGKAKLSKLKDSGHCRKCKSTNVFVEGKPPLQAFQVCRECGYRLQVCGAKNRSGGPCLRSVMDNGRCKLHGGAATGRPIIHGRRSKFLPVRLAERVADGMSDPNLISVLEDVALIDALIADECQGLGEDTPAQLWAKASEVAYSMKLNLVTEDFNQLAKQVEILIQIMNNGEGIYQRISRILNMTEQKRKLSETEMKRLVHLKQFITATELAVIGAQLLTLINENVKDSKERDRIAAGLVSLFRPSVS